MIYLGEQTRSAPAVHQLLDHNWASQLGSALRRLREFRGNKVCIDFSALEWINPLPAMNLACELLSAAATNIRNSTGSGFEIVFDLGEIELLIDEASGDTNASHLAAVSFLSDTSFFRSLSEQFRNLSTKATLKYEFTVRGQENNVANLDKPRAALGIQSRTVAEHLKTLPGGNSNYASELLNFHFSSIQEMTRESAQHVTGKLIEEIKIGFKARWASDHYHREQLHHRMRVVLHELIENAIEHAYSCDGEDGNTDITIGFFGVYGRIRHPSSICTGSVPWGFEDGIVSLEPCLDDHEQYQNDVVELYVTDVGKSLLSEGNFENWQMSAETQLQTLERQLSAGADKLGPRYYELIGLRDNTRSQLSAIRAGKFLQTKQGEDKEKVTRFYRLREHMFYVPISSSNRDERGRTVMAGLQHIGDLLTGRWADETGLQNHVRIYTKGEWVGGRLPWTNTPDTERVFGVNESEMPLGTSFHIRFPIVPREVEYKSQDWKLVTTSNIGRSLLLSSLSIDDGAAVDSISSLEPSQPLEQQLRQFLPDTPCVEVDLRDEDRPIYWSDLGPLALEVVVRPSREAGKSRLHEILVEVLEPYDDKRKAFVKSNNVRVIVLADLSPSQAMDFTYLLKRGGVNPKINIFRRSIRIYLVSQDWAVSCFEHKDDKWTQNLDGAQDFIENNLFLKMAESDTVNYGDPAVFFEENSQQGFAGLPLVARILRKWDSEIFWETVQRESKGAKTPFYNEHINWFDQEQDRASEEYLIGSNPSEECERPNPNIVLGFLDFSHAVALALCFKAARRSLRRVLRLFPDYPVIACDDLVDIVIGPSFNARNGQRELLDNGTPLEECILVGSVLLGGKTLQHYQDRLDVKFSKSIHVLKHWSFPGKSDNKLFALNWSPILSEAPTKKPKELSLYRLAASGHTIRGDGDGLHIVRWGRPSNPERPFDNCLYWDDPQQMYDYWSTLGILRTGHWHSGRRHELLGLNILRAVELDRLDNGRTVTWLADQIERAKDIAQDNGFEFFFVYLSHRTTDFAVQHIQTWKPHLLSRDSFFPVKLVTPSAKSPSFIAPLTIERLQKWTQKKLSEAESHNKLFVLFFNDRAVSGKLGREISELLRSLKYTPASEGDRGLRLDRNTDDIQIETIHFVDRRGVPFSSLALPEKNKRNSLKKFGLKDLWRWDVPSLGFENSCPLCKAIERAKAFVGEIEPAYQSQVERWINIWSARDTRNFWGDTNVGLPNVHFDEFYEGGFGLSYPDNSLVKNKQEFALVRRDSTSMVSSAIEISRSTIQKRYPVQRAKNEHAKPSARNKPAFDFNLRLELLCSYILLMGSDLSYDQMYEAFDELSQILWMMPEASQASALACVTCFLMPESMAAKLVQQLVDWLSTASKIEDAAAVRRPRHIDAELLYGVLRSRLGTDHTLLPTIEPETLRRTDHFFCYIAGGTKTAFKEVIRRLFLTIGYRKGHSGVLPMLMDETDLMLSKFYITISTLKSCLDVVCAHVHWDEHLISQVKYQAEVLERDSWDCLKVDDEGLHSQQCVTELLNTHPGLNTEVRELCRDIKAQLCPFGENAKDVEKYVSMWIDDVKKRKHEMADYSIRIQKISNHMQIQSKKFLYYADKRIAEFVKDCIANIRHCGGSAITDSALHGELYIEVHEDFVVIDIRNVLLEEEMEKGIKDAYSPSSWSATLKLLEAPELKVSMINVGGQRLVSTKISIPSVSLLVEMEAQ